jgi:S1/P1 nuclease
MRKVVFGTLAVVGAVVATASPAFAWDYPGHRMVGAIADTVLEQHYTKTYDKVKDLLAKKDEQGKVIETRSLAQVAVFPDCAKNDSIRFCGRAPSDEEQNYVERNPNHGKYHYTDVPLKRPKYESDIAGTNNTDVVHMINYIVRQLRAKDPKDKPKLRDVSLTDTEAVWLLAHLVGDIHQPLHVGAAYFDKKTCKTLVDPNDVPGGTVNTVEAFGGNDILLKPDDKNPGSKLIAAPALNLHLFWDGTAVAAAMRSDNLASSEQDYARFLASTLPAGWETVGDPLTGDPATLAAKWATEILPAATDAHGPMAITKDESDPTGTKCKWNMILDPGYETRARDLARNQLRKAGFRLAAILVAIFPNTP